DDLHWVDQTSAEFIVHLFQLTDRLPILFICAFRPDHTSPAWMIKQAAETDYNHRYTEINLSPLSSNESNALVNALFTSDEIPLDVRRMILEKSDGNPFFMEEVIRTLIDNDIVTQNRDNSHLIVTSRIDNFTIPDNLHALLAARIDRLEENAKHVLQLASVIGRSFNQPVLEIICDDKSELDYELNNLQRLDLILEYAREPYIEYIFRQALTQETVYNTILLKYRREFHKRVGEALLQLYPDRVDEYVSVLGYHFYQAQDPRASIYFRRAGDSAFRLYANAEAIGYYSKAIETTMWVEHPDLDQLVYLYGRRGRSFELNSQFSEALGNYKDMEELAQKYQVISVELNAIIAQAQIYSVPSTEFNLLTGLELIEKAKAMAKALNDQAALAKIYWIMTNLYRFHRSLDKAQQMGEKAIALARKLGLEEQLAYSLTDSAHTYNLNGQVVRAREVSLEAAELWRKMGNQPMLADCLGGLASIHV
ncbi:MAG: ATP-binding protein, partial [Anaerolineales bacterium]